MTDLTVELCERRLASPLILASGPLTYSAEGIRAAFQAGAAAAVTKTLSLAPAVNPTPHITRGQAGSLLNTEKWADLSAEQWIERELPDLRGRQEGLVIASLGHDERAVRALAARVEAAGADLLEVVSYRSQDMAAMVRAAKQAVSIPVLAKMSANWPDLLEVAAACVAAAVDGITAIDSIGPVLQIDIETARPTLGGPYGRAWLSGAAIKPIAVCAVADIARRCPVPIVGVGGVSRAEDVVEMMMAGATAVGLHSAALLKGLGLFHKMGAALSRWLDGHGYARAAQLTGLALPHLQDGEDTRPLAFAFDEQACSGCRLCVTVCAYRARTMSDKQMAFDAARCRSCGLCTSVCPTGALSLSEQPAS